MRLVIHGNETARECAALATFFASLGEAREQDAKERKAAAVGLSDAFRRGVSFGGLVGGNAAPAGDSPSPAVAPAPTLAAAEATSAEKPKRTRAPKEKPEPVIGEAAPTPPPVVEQAVAEALPQTAAQQPAPSGALTTAVLATPAAAPTPPPPPATASEGAPTKQDCLAALEKLLGAKGMDACGAALAAFKDATTGEPCKAVRQLAVTDYAAFIAKCEESCQ